MKHLLHTIGFVSSIYIPLTVAILLLIFIAPSHVTNNLLTYNKVFWYTGLLFVLTNIIGHSHAGQLRD